MATLIDLRRRIRSVRNSQQVTQAMKTVSTAKFRKAQRVVLESRPYWHIFPDLIGRAARWAGESAHPLLIRREEKRAEVVVITSDKGLAGAFNSNLLLKAEAFIADKSRTEDLGIVLVGKKAATHFRNARLRVDRSYAQHTDRLTRQDIKNLAEFLMGRYAFYRTDAVYIIYNEFKSILAPRIMVARVLPLGLDVAGEPGEAAWGPDWEPEAMAFLRALLPLFVESQIHHALRESQAAEQASRMMAMDNATKNAEDLVADLVLVLNKIRQASITKELLEIMTAVEALSS